MLSVGSSLVGSRRIKKDQEGAIGEIGLNGVGQ